MGFHDIRFPTTLTPGAMMGPAFNTGVTEMSSGAVQTVSRWDGGKHHYDASRSVAKLDDLYDIKTFFMARDGSANSWRWMDKADYSTTINGRTPADGNSTVAVSHNDVVIGTGNGTLKTFQLKKLYVSGPSTRSRNITKPVAGTVLVGLATVNQPTGWSVNTTTGVITFTTAPGAGVQVSAGCEFDVPVRFGEDLDAGAFQQSIDNFNAGGVRSIPVIEDFDGPIVDEEYPYGGSDNFNVTASFGVNLTRGAAQFWNVTVASLTATMPSEGLIGEGFGHLVVKNTGTQTITVARSDGTTEFTIVAGGTALFMMGTFAGVRRWFAV